MRSPRDDHQHPTIIWPDQMWDGCQPINALSFDHALAVELGNGINVNIGITLSRRYVNAHELTGCRYCPDELAALTVLGRPEGVLLME